MALGQGDDVGAHVTAAWNAAGNQNQSRPQILVFILPDKDSNTYGRIKRSTECRYGVVSQCLFVFRVHDRLRPSLTFFRQYAQVTKCQGQYISNVCLKVNVSEHRFALFLKRFLNVRRRSLVERLLVQLVRNPVVRMVISLCRLPSSVPM